MNRTCPRKCAFSLPNFVFALAACLVVTASTYAQAPALPGDWDGFDAVSKAPVVWQITRANNVLTFQEVGGSNATFTGTRTGNTVTDSKGGMEQSPPVTT